MEYRVVRGDRRGRKHFRGAEEEKGLDGYLGKAEWKKAF